MRRREFAHPFTPGPMGRTAASGAAAGVLVAAFAVITARDAAADPARITLRQTLAQPPAPGEAAVATTVIGRNGITGDVLPFLLGIDYQCPEPAGRRQLLLSIADTALLTDATALPSPQTLQLEVPLRQLAWLQPAKTCRELPAARRPAAGDSVRYFRLRARATAFATLTCTTADGRTETAITTAPLDVWLGCEPPGPVAEQGAAPAGVTNPTPDSAAGK
jgi:hypothetical protein